MNWFSFAYGVATTLIAEGLFVGWLIWWAWPAKVEDEEDR